MSLTRDRHAGTATVLRHGDLHDVEAVIALHERCSDRTRALRFHAPLPRVSPQVARQLLDPVAGWSLLAEELPAPGADGEVPVVALACVAAVSSFDLEVGLLVEDAWQSRGVGTRMLRAVAEEAAERGYRTLLCLAQPDNDAVPATVRRAGLAARATRLDGLVQLEVPVHAA